MTAKIALLAVMLNAAFAVFTEKTMISFDEIEELARNADEPTELNKVG